MTDLERIARELSWGDGFDPDVMVYPYQLAVGKGGLAVVPLPALNQPVAQWRLYENYVRASLSMIVEMPEETDLREVISGILTETEMPEPVLELTETEASESPPTWRERRGLNA